MKPHLHSVLPRLLTLLIILAAGSSTLSAQTARINLNLPEFEQMSAQAEESVEVTLDGEMLRLASRFLNEDKEDREVALMISRLSGIYVRSFTFSKEGMYQADLASRIRKQVGPSWKKIVNVRSRTEENVEIYAQPDGENLTGLLIISAEPTEFTVVNIVGPVDLAQLSHLEGSFGIPRLDHPADPKSEKAGH